MRFKSLAQGHMSSRSLAHSLCVYSAWQVGGDDDQSMWSWSLVSAQDGGDAETPPQMDLRHWRPPCVLIEGPFGTDHMEEQSSAPAGSRAALGEWGQRVSV